jgi:hypothetical protein|tara:strand:- start:31 stop:309 length:279 start_codon:yes stop_codon:yes gene_type:complete
MDKEKEQGNVDSKFKLLNFPKPEEEVSEVLPEYNINAVFSSGKTIQIICSGFIPMPEVGIGIVGFWSGNTEAIHTILNCNKIDFLDVEEREV